MQKAQQEIRERTGNKGFIDENDLQKLVYLKAIVKEATRLHPPAPLLVPRETIEKCVVSGYEIEAKTRVYINAYAIGRDPESWESPDEFFPERFTDSSIDFRGQDFELIPFGAGRRMCPGISMGLAQCTRRMIFVLYQT
ncbi:cytochrome P450 71A1-like [Apium graveolens]|uniref:cytochrome P450 71A1-like n=1 Tax=Apium graveolens TaxID=4045 RepID=UPI003D79B647